MPNDTSLKRMILDKAHHTIYTMHPKSMKMYQNLKQNFWWNRTKKKIARYVSKCQNCQQVKVEHKRLAGKLQSLPILE